MTKTYTALKLPKVDFWSKFQRSISNRSRVIVGGKNVTDGWMDGQIKINRLAVSLLSSCESKNYLITSMLRFYIFMISILDILLVNAIIRYRITCVIK